MIYLEGTPHLWRLVDGSDLSSDAQWDVFVLSVPAIQVSHPLTARLPPEVQEAVSNGVVLKHDIVHVSVFLGEEQRKLNSCNSIWDSCVPHRVGGSIPHPLTETVTAMKSSHAHTSGERLHASRKKNVPHFKGAVAL